MNRYFPVILLLMSTIVTVNSWPNPIVAWFNGFTFGIAVFLWMFLWTISRR